jgi:hypothetical protein
MHAPTKSRLSGEPSLFRSLLARATGLALLALLATVPARALETVMQDDFALASGVPVDPAKWHGEHAGGF